MPTCEDTSLKWAQSQSNEVNNEILGLTISTKHFSLALYQGDSIILLLQHSQIEFTPKPSSYFFKKISAATAPQ